MEHVRITKMYSGGVEDHEAKPVAVPCFSLDVDRGQTFIDGTTRPSSGGKVAMALDTGGRHIMPQLDMAEITGVYANGLAVRGVCTEDMGGTLRRVYCEWFVFFPPFMGE